MLFHLVTFFFKVCKFIDIIVDIRHLTMNQHKFFFKIRIFLIFFKTNMNSNMNNLIFLQNEYEFENEGKIRITNIFANI